MVVQFINVESFFFLRKLIGPQNPLMGASIAYFEFLPRKKNSLEVARKVMMNVDEWVMQTIAQTWPWKKG